MDFFINIFLNVCIDNIAMKMLHNVCRYMYNRAFLCVLVYCTWLSIYVGVSPICVHNTMSFRYVSGVFVHMRVHFLSEPPPSSSAAALFSWALVWLELHKLFRHVIVVALREDSQHCQACLVHVDTSAQRHPAGDTALAGYVLHLQHGYADSAVLSGKAVVLYTHLQLVALWTDLSAQGAKTEDRIRPMFYVLTLFLFLFNVFCVSQYVYL